MYKVINVENWAKRKNFEWFNTFSNPCYAIDTEIDVTKVVKFSKETKTSPLAKALNNLKDNSLNCLKLFK